MAFPTLTPGKPVLLKGKSFKLTDHIDVPSGEIVIDGAGPGGAKATIEYDGPSGQAVGSPALACFVVSKSGTKFVLKNVKVKIPAKGAVVHTSVHGDVACEGVEHTAGSIVYSEGADSITITNCFSTGTPDKYWFINATNLLKNLKIDNTGIKGKPIKQGKREAAIRLMQVDRAEIVGLEVQGSNFKQAVQDRPGGKPGDVFHEHIWRNCTITGEVDLGNFEPEQDEKTKKYLDKNYPFGTLQRSRWIGCKVDKFNKTFHGKDAFGIGEVKQEP